MDSLTIFDDDSLEPYKAFYALNKEMLVKYEDALSKYNPCDHYTNDEYEEYYKIHGALASHYRTSDYEGMINRLNELINWYVESCVKKGSVIDLHKDTPLRRMKHLRTDLQMQQTKYERLLEKITGRDYETQSSQKNRIPIFECERCGDKVYRLTGGLCSSCDTYLHPDPDDD